jgi:hypothetical protein
LPISWLQPLLKLINFGFNFTQEELDPLTPTSDRPSWRGGSEVYLQMIQNKEKNINKSWFHHFASFLSGNSTN